MGGWLSIQCRGDLLCRLVVVSDGYKLSEAEGSFIRGFSVFI